jgi:hypothetical protein
LGLEKTRAIAPKYCPNEQRNLKFGGKSRRIEKTSPELTLILSGESQIIRPVGNQLMTKSLKNPAAIEQENAGHRRDVASG